MFQLNILQNQWAVLALLGGVAAALAIVLSYVAFWRTESDPADRPRRVPWILIVLYAVIIVYAVAYVAMNVMNPPTW